MRLSALSAASAIFAACSLIAACGGEAPQAPDTGPATETLPPAAAAAPAAVSEAIDTEQIFAALPPPYNTADYNRGRRTFKLCQSCHTLTEGGPSLVGPNLYGLFGRPAASVGGFSYSRALQEADFVWTAEQLDEWLQNPRGFLPGNKMSFAGVRKPEDRLAVIAYIMSETGFGSE